MEVAQETPTMDIPTSTHSSARRGESMLLDGNTNAKPAPMMTKEGAAAVSVRADAFDPDATRKLSVLLVEDDHATLVFVKALLKSCGHTGESRRTDGDDVTFRNRFFFPFFFWRGKRGDENFYEFGRAS